MSSHPIFSLPNFQAPLPKRGGGEPLGGVGRGVVGSGGMGGREPPDAPAGWVVTAGAGRGLETSPEPPPKKATNIYYNEINECYSSTEQREVKQREQQQQQQQQQKQNKQQHNSNSNRGNECGESRRDGSTYEWLSGHVNHPTCSHPTFSILPTCSQAVILPPCRSLSSLPFQELD